MAPAFLQFAERLGVPEARNAMSKGFRWVFGENQMHKSMLLPDSGLSIRSQVRRGEMRTRAFQIVGRFLIRFWADRPVWQTPPAFSCGLNAGATSWAGYFGHSASAMICLSSLIIRFSAMGYEYDYAFGFGDDPRDFLGSTPHRHFFRAVSRNHENGY